MHSIYGLAVLTIAAVHGSTAWAGLPGIRPGSRKIEQHIEEIQSLRLTNRPPTFDDATVNSVWNSRAWVYQERALSRRTLFNAEHQFFFKCEHRDHALTEDVAETAFGRKAHG